MYSVCLCICVYTIVDSMLPIRCQDFMCTHSKRFQCKTETGWTRECGVQCCTYSTHKPTVPDLLQCVTREIFRWFRFTALKFFHFWHNFFALTQIDCNRWITTFSSLLFLSICLAHLNYFFLRSEADTPYIFYLKQKPCPWISCAHVVFLLLSTTTVIYSVLIS